MITIHLTPKDSINESLKKYTYDSEITLYLSAGVYIEKVVIYHHHLKLIGESMESTIITYSDYSYKMHTDGLLYNTFRTSTVTLFGHHVHMKNLTIRNDAGSGFTIGQAIALSLYGDQTLLENCFIEGHQDTLFIGPLPEDLIERYDGFLMSEQLKRDPLTHFFKDCTIKGDVDFIFGSGTAYFNKCNIIATGNGYICAPSTSMQTPNGLVFIDSLIENVSNEEVYLARPWREYGSTIFIDCQFKGLFAISRYDAWNKINMRFLEKPYIFSPLSKELLTEEEERLRKTFRDEPPL